VEAVVDLRAQLGSAPLERDVVVVAGPEAEPFLQGQLSQDVAGLAVGSSTASLLLQPTGRVDAWLRVTRTHDESFLLDVDAGHGPAVQARLSRFRLRTEVELTVATWRGFALRGPGAAAQGAPGGVHALPAPWREVEAIDLLAPEAAEPPPVAPAPPTAFEALRVELGVPAMGSEITDATIPAELGQWLIDASVSFTKGCYTGQELVARIDSRGGNVPRPLRGLVLAGDAVEVGAEVRRDGAAVGQVTSVARSAALGPIALAVVARSAPVGDEVTVAGPGGEVAGTIRELPLR